MSGPLIELKDLSASFGANGAVFEEFSLRLEADERLALTGPNGCGKTTLLHVLMGLVAPASGSVEVLGKPRCAERDFKEVRREVGLLFQDSDDQLFCPTVHEDVAFGPFNLGQSHAEVHEVVHETLDLLGLRAFENRITYQLSHGQRRLVALATILAMKPRILLLDEPTAGLDEAHEARLTDILLKLPQEMIIVSHNQAFLDQVATRVVAFGA